MNLNKTPTIPEKWRVIASGAKQSGFDEEYPDSDSWKARLLRFALLDFKLLISINEVSEPTKADQVYATLR